MAIKRITTNLIKDSDIATVDIANNAITAAKITDGNITTAKLADLNVTAGKLAATLDLTGKTITVATATTGDSDTSPASTAFVQQEIAALVDSSPSSLNTLNELAAALGDDASFSTTVTNSIATKLPLAGGTMTGALAINSGTANTGLTITSTDSASWITMTDPTASLFFGNSGGGFSLWTGGTESMKVDTTGKLSIGGATPQGNLTIKGAASDDIDLLTFSEDGTNQSFSFNGNFAGSGSTGNNLTLDSYWTNDIMAWTGDGKVGIGTTSPEKALHIRSTSNQLRLQDSTNDKKYDLNVDGDKFMIDDMTAGANRFAISGANVGIGTTSPQGKFVVSNSGAGGFEFEPDTTSFSVANTNYIASYDRSASAYRDIVIDLGGAESQAVRFKAGGNVGIGTSSPVAKLDIRMSDSNGAYGRGRDGNLNLENTNTSVTEGGWLSISGYMGNSAAGGQYQMGYISGGKQTTAADGDYGGYLTFWTTSGGANGEANSGGYERMRIDSSGNVGIGTTSPDTLLHLSNNGTTPATIRIERNDTTISDTNIYGGIEFEGQDASAASAAGVRGKILGVAEGATGEMALTFETAGGYGSSTERMRIDSSGNLLVGNTVVNPVSGFASQRGFGYAASTGKVEIATDANAAAMELGKNNSNDGSILVFRKQSNTVGSIGANSGDIYIASTGTYSAGLMFEGSSGAQDIRPCSSTGALLDGAVDLGDSSARFKDLYLSGGVNFSANANASGMTSELLDDYEEGTWTPACGATLSVASGQYTKIGNQVTVHYHIVTTGGLPTSTGQVIITGLPFTSNSGSLTAGPIYARYYTPNDSTLTSLVQDSESQIRLMNTNDQNFDYTIWGELEASSNNSVYIIGSVTYIV